jgi:hypothetical protein
VSGQEHRSARAGVQHRLAQVRRRLARARMRVVRPRAGGRPPSRIEALLPWAPVLVGIGILIGFIISIFVLPVSGPSQPAFPNLGAPPVLPPPEPAEGPPGEPAGLSPRSMVPEAYEVQYSPTPAAPPPPPAPEFDPGVTGKYKLDEVYGDVFIGAVIVTNESGEAAGWTAELAFGGDVGELNTFWVDGTSQPSLQQVDDRFLFTSTQDVPPESSVLLKMHFDRSGFDILPKSCLVNGEDCLIHYYR